MGKRGRHFMISFMATVTGVYLAFALALFVFQRSLLYHPDSSAPELEASGIGTMDVVTLKTSDGLSLLSWYRRAAPRRPTLVYFHGNAGNIESRGFKVRDYLDAGFGLLLVGYRGYGGNPGKPSEEGLYLDGRAALAFLAADGVIPENLVLYGESLGTGIAVQLASERDRDPLVGALVLEAPYTSIAEVAGNHYPFLPAGLLVKDRFDSAAKIALVGAPVFIFHGDRDRTIPIRFGKGLFAAAVEPKVSLWLAGASHNNLYEFGASRAVQDFLEGHFGPSGGGG
jgi:fermentation-respiration switch protein FrsA (DUF1100 family)